MMFFFSFNLVTETFLSLARWWLNPMAFIFPHVVTTLCVDCDLEVVYPSSLAHQSSPEQSARSLIYGHRLSIKIPMDLNALLFCARMVKRRRTYQLSTSVDVLA
jgi:hypothetical protein